MSFYFRGVADSDLEGMALGFVKTYHVKMRFNCDLGQAERSDANNESSEIPVWFKTRKGVPGIPSAGPARDTADRQHIRHGA